MRDVPGYARRVPVSEIAAEDYNCNIRRYVDNAPPPEPHDVRAHMHGGVPVTEIEALARFWLHYPGLRERCFVSRPHVGWVSPQGVSQQVREDASVYAVLTRSTGSAYADFAPAITDRRAIAKLVKTDSGVAAARERILQTLEAWWQRNLPLIEALAPIDPRRGNGRNGNVYGLRRKLLADIADSFSGQTLLTDHQIRGAFARYLEDLKADLKSIAASGWGPELIPDADILQSQFPALLVEMEQKRLHLAELAALFAAADEEDYEDGDDSGVLPGDEVKALKAQLKELKAIRGP
jgi:type I restriction enzyme M protein